MPCDRSNLKIPIRQQEPRSDPLESAPAYAGIADGTGVELRIK